MKLEKDENDKSSSLIKKLKNNINKTHNQPERYNSAFKKRPFTSLKCKKLDFDKNSNYTKNNYFMPKLEKANLISKYSTHNLYQNKHSFIWGRNKSNSNTNKYYEKEELVDKLIKLKKAFNRLNSQNTEQKIKIYKQKKELTKQNKILNEVNIKYFFEKFYQKNDDDSLGNIDSGAKSINGDNKLKISKSFPKSKSNEDIKLIRNNIKNIPNDKSIDSPDNLAHMSSFNIKELYRKMLLQNERKDQEIAILNERLEHIKISNEALLSNMKLKYKQLMDDYNKKKNEIEKLKINIRCTKYNEIMKEKEVYESEMINIKNKFNKAMEAQEKYKICLKKKKNLIDENNIKDMKIVYLENKLKLNTKNYSLIIENLKNELNKKEKQIQKIENDKKKLMLKINSQNEDLITSKSKKKFKELIIQSKFNNFSVIPDSIEKGEKKEEEKWKEEEENKTNEVENIQSKTQDPYVNHNMNFSNSNNIKGRNIEISSSENENKKNINSVELKNNNLGKELFNNNEKNNEQNIEKEEKEETKIIKNELLNNKINLYPELFHIYIELKKRNINIESFVNEIFLKLNNDNTILDNKLLYVDSIAKYFNISNESDSKKIIENSSNKVFMENKTLEETKKHILEIFNEFSNINKNEKEREEELLKKLNEIDVKNFKEIIYKYDDADTGLVYFNQMISIINELNLDEYMEEILLMAKDPIVFNLMDYNILMDNINKKEEQKEKGKEQIKDESNYEDEFEKESKIMDENEKEEKKENNKEKKEEKNENNGQKDENKGNNESSITNKYEGEFESKSFEKNSKQNELNNESNKNDFSEKILKNLAHIIVIEGSTPNIYLSSLKEIIKEENNNIIGINSNKLFHFMEEKNIQINEKEKEEIINKYKIVNKEKNNEEFIDFNLFTEKLFEYMKNDDGISNDDDFMKNIKSLDIDGID